MRMRAILETLPATFTASHEYSMKTLSSCQQKTIHVSMPFFPAAAYGMTDIYGKPLP
jgi:hypothetical protein